MSPRIARLLVTLHAAQWRMRYGPEFEALLIETSPTPTNLSDALGSALASQKLVAQLGISAMLATAAAALILGCAHVATAGAQITTLPPAPRPATDRWNQPDWMPCHGSSNPRDTC